MKRRYCWIAACAVLGLSACCGTAPLPRPTFIHYPAETAYPTWRWIGLKRDPARPCPGARGWRVGSLFDLGKLSGDARKRAARLGLDAYCLYETRRADQGLPLETIRSLSRAEPDAMAIVLSAGDALRGLTSPAFESDFLLQAGRTRLPDGVGPPRARLVLLDTQPTGEGIPWLPDKPYRSPHGYALANIAGRLTSNGDRFEQPTVEIATRLAMPYPSYDATNPGMGTPDLQNGGFVGTIGGLAQAVLEEIAAWETKKAHSCEPGGQGCGTAPHLVLNLSLGWDGQKFGGNAEARVCDMAPAVQGVYKALELAAGGGALVIAAAGNRGGGPDATTGPLLPAGWESRAAEDTVPELKGKPFIYAVGGVQAQNYPLASSRLRGLPRLTAYADHAVVKDRNSQPTATLTGTSVAAVVVSSAAAVVWQARPELAADGVMSLLYASGDPLKSSGDTPKLADFYYSSPAPATEARRISLCAALAKACSEGACSPPQCPRAFARQAALAQALSAFHPWQTIDGAALHEQLPSLPKSCKAQAIYRRPNDQLDYPCPYEQLPSLVDDPETTPQPGADPCPNCTLTRDTPLALSFRASAAVTPARALYTLRIEIPSSWTTPLYATNLEINQLNGRDENEPSISYAIEQKLNPGQSLEISGLDLRGGQTATLNFVSQPPSGGPRSIESPVFIDGLAAGRKLVGPVSVSANLPKAPGAPGGRK